MISDSYENKALVLVLIRCVKLYFQCKRCLLGLIMNDFFFQTACFGWRSYSSSSFSCLKKGRYRILNTNNFEIISFSVRYRFSAVSNFMKVCKGGNLPSIKRPLNSNETWRESQLKNFLPSAIFSMCSEHETCLSFSFLSFSISFDEIFILLHIPIINEKSCNSYHHKNCNPKLVHLDFLWVFKFTSLIQTLRHLIVRTRYLYH